MVLLLPATILAQYQGGNGGGSATASLIASPLPVELISLTGSVEHSHVILVWKTVTEINNFGFEVERKGSLLGQTNNAPWVKVGFVNGNGTTNASKSYSFIDNQASGRVFYRLKQIDRNGKFSYSPMVEVVAGNIPNELSLVQNYPNPFNPSTTLSFSVPYNGRAILKIFNTLGQEVATLFNGEAQAGIFNQVQFNASGFASGLYFSRLEFDGKIQLKKMTLMK
ncbi:MAG TPA: T9SS type A sorting domain-containing protein [Nitrosomonas sp.]|nr:T9SS type A sorting domain-containing protein [Nitrosomonas sp.]